MSATYDAPQTVQGRLEQIEQDLAERQNDYEKAAKDRARYIRDWEKRLLIAQKTAHGPNAEVRKATAFVAAIEVDDGELYQNLTDAESEYDAIRVAVKVMEDRATIGQSILKSQGRA